MLSSFHTSVVTGSCAIPNSTYVTSVGYDGRILVWECTAASLAFEKNLMII